MANGPVFVGCAGWSLPRAAQQAFGAGESHLQRYASRLNATEINSSFHRPHSRATYERWADGVPESFRFSVKLPKAITHAQGLVDAGTPLEEFLQQAGGLGSRLGCLLVQLPPKVALEEGVARTFFKALRSRHSGPVAVEPRHASWFTPEADELLVAFRLARVLADPVRHAPGQLPGGWPDMIYLRLHGSPRMYYSAYEPALIEALARRIAQAAREGRAVWCIFDNTAGQAAADNALALAGALSKETA